MKDEAKKRAILIVLDSAGIGALPDAAEFGDESSHTLGNIYWTRGKLELPNLYALGLAHIEDSFLPKPDEPPRGAFGRAAEKTFAKDTTSGHWELAGLPMEIPFRTYPNGFPQELIGEYERRIGRETLGNEVASGTEIIQRLGDLHVETGKPIVYTSADSVFQIAAHEDLVPVPELYRICETAREMLTGDLAVGRVIARPFVGTPGQFTRTANRHDYSLSPPGETMLDRLQKAGKSVISVGKIVDIFNGRGITEAVRTKNNAEGIDATLNMLKKDFSGLCFVNLVDFDMLYGHRNDADGYAAALSYFDSRLPELLAALREDDVLLITADHGCDPGTPSTDHSREYIPFLAFGQQVQPKNMGTLHGFDRIGAAVEKLLSGEMKDGFAL